MKALKIVLGGVAALILLLVLVSFALPDSFSVERSVHIDAPPELVFEEVNSLRRWPAWSPWLAADPTIQNTYNDIESGVGSEVRWTSEDSGDGIQRITLSRPHERIETALDFGERGQPNAFFDFTAAAGGTDVTWGLEGASEGVMGRYFGLVVDSMVGGMYEDGLARLKAHVEAR